MENLGKENRKSKNWTVVESKNKNKGDSESKSKPTQVCDTQNVKNSVDIISRKNRTSSRTLNACGEQEFIHVKALNQKNAIIEQLCHKRKHKLQSTAHKKVLAAEKDFTANKNVSPKTVLDDGDEIEEEEVIVEKVLLRKDKKPLAVITLSSEDES